MKKIFALIITALLWTAGFAQLWTPKNVPPFGDQSGPEQPVFGYTPASFTIDSIVYVYDLVDDYVYTDADTGNFYAYHPATDTWVELANFPGLQREGPISFAIGNYGYIGAGEIATEDPYKLTDFYQYNPSSNTWTAMAAYPDTAIYPGSFAIDSLGYVVGGRQSKKCYQYNPGTNQWTRKSDVPFLWYNPFSTATSTKGYVGFGQTFLYGSASDSMYEYNPVADSWTAKANSPGAIGFEACPPGFCINNKIYIANNNILLFDTFLLDIFDIASNTWTRSALFNYPAISTYSANYVDESPAGFSVNGLGYIFFGVGSSGFWQYNPALNFSARCTATDSLCPGDAVTFTVASNINFGASNYFKLQFFTEVDAPEYSFSPDSVAATGPGTYTLHVPWGYYGTSGYTLTQITVSSTNPLAQAVFDTTVHVLKTGPYANIASTYSICEGTQLNLSGNSGVGSFYASHSWSNASGVFDTSISVTLSPSTTSTYYLQEKIQQTGCALNDTFTVNVNTAPIASVASTFYNICPATNISIGGTAVSGYTYNWADRNGFTSTTASAAVQPSVSDVYYLTVTDTSTGCSSYDTVRVTARTPPTQTICLVTADSASDANIVVWEKLDRDATDSFFIYREITTNSYEKIGAVPADSLSQFEDDGANPAITSYQYKISDLDTCGNESAMSPYHNTIHLVYQQGGQLSWNPYQIEDDSTTPVASFVVLKDSLGNGNWQPFITVPGNQYAVTDIYFAGNPNAQYRVSANFSYPCTPTRGYTAVLSNIATQNPASVQNLSNPHFSIYPNPATTLLHITYNGAQPEWISVYDVSGQRLSETKYTSPQVNIARLSPGIYFIAIRTGAHTERYKFVKI